MRDARYSSTAIWLHWVTAFLIIAAFVLGLTVDEFPKSWDGAIVNLHVLIGLSILVLSGARLWWRISHRPPELPITVSPLVRRVSLGGHFLLYTLMFVVPLIGVPTLLFRGRGIDFGLFQIPPLLARDPQIFRPLTEVHEIAAYALILLAIGHAIAALYHQFILKDGILLRILGARRSG